MTDQPPLTAARFAEIEGRAQAATPGEWRTERSVHHGRLYVVPASPARSMSILCDTESDAVFIAHARTDIPALLSEVRRLREALVKIANLPRGDFVLHGPRLPAAIARAALPEETPNG